MEQWEPVWGSAQSPYLGSLPHFRMYGKVSGSFFLFHVGHIVATICQFVEVQLHKGC
jgi:hypothetical protein